jgi:hypothetical protein
MAEWKLRGPVRTLRSEHAAWDASLGTWQAPRSSLIVTFRRDGQASASESPNSESSSTGWARVYDDDGRLREQRFWSNDVPRITMVYSYDTLGRLETAESVTPDGTRRQTETCRYDEAGRRARTIFLPRLPAAASIGVGVSVNEQEDGTLSESVVHDADGRLVQRVVFLRDQQGRVLTEVVHVGGGNVPADVLAVMDMAFADEVFSKTEYTYDVNGRLIEKAMSMGILSEEHWAFQYDDHDNLIAETSIRRSREVETDDHGEVLSSKEEPVIQQHSRFQYQYDSHGNWTERVVSYRLDPQTEFRRSNIERRTITYYDSASDTASEAGANGGSGALRAY